MPSDEFVEIPIDDDAAALLREYDVIDDDVISHSAAEAAETLVRDAEIDALLREYDVVGDNVISHSAAEAAEALARDTEIDAILQEYDVVGSVDTERAELDVWWTDRINDAFSSAVSRTYSRWTAPHLAPVPSGPPAVDRQLVPMEELSVTPVRVPSDELGLTEATMDDFMALYSGN